VCSQFILSEDQDVYYRPSKQFFGTGTPQVHELRIWFRMPGDVVFIVFGVVPMLIATGKTYGRIRAGA
jgi:nitric oxide reductase large subunit